MFNSLILDVAIGLVFVYFILSLLCSVVIEVITGWLKLRGRMLRNKIGELIHDPTALKNLYNHPLFLGQNPSYISSRSFVLSLLDSLKSHPQIQKNIAEAPPLNSVANIQSLVKALPEKSYIRDALVPVLESAGTDLDKAMEGMEKWYDEAMARVSGWYKRWTQVVVLVLALIAAAVLNADTIKISQTLFLDQTVRNAMVATATEVTKTGTPQEIDAKLNTVRSFLEKTLKPPVPSQPVPPKKKGEASPATATPEKTPRPVAEKPPLISLPMGWPDWCTMMSTEGIFDLRNFLGIFITALMVTLGSNFWFDLLNRLINLRSSGKKPLTVGEEKANA